MPLTEMKQLLDEAEHYYTDCGDGAMVWRRWGEGRPLVLLHGGSGSWTHWIKTIPALRQTHSVWVADLPGLGDSAMPSLPHTPQSCAVAVAHGIRELVSQPATLICFSFGCHVGTLAAGALGDRINGIFINGSAALGLGRAQNLSLPKERSSMSAVERRAVHHSVLANLMFADAGNIDDQAIALQALNIEKARFRSREFADSSDVRDGLANVRAPLKSIWGARDVVAHPDLASCLAALRLHHPECQHRFIDGAGHWVMYEAADAFNAALLEMLAEID